MAVRTIAADGSGDYTTLAAWWDSLPATLTEPEIAEIKGELVTTAAYLPGKVTSPTNYIELRAAPGHKHTGAPGTGARIIGNNGTTGAIIDGGCRHYRYVDLELVSNGTTGPILHGSAVTGATLLVSGCIIRAPSMTGTTTMCAWGSATMTAALENSIFVSGARCMDSRSVQSMTVRNCTWWSLSDQLVVIAGATTDFKNCYAGRVGGTQQVWSNAATPTGSHNASSDTTATARFPTGSINSVVGADAFENPTTGDFRLKTGSVLIDAGVTISGFTTDIIGTTRPQGAAYDVGAFEYASGGPPPTPPSGTVTIGTITPSTTSASVPYSYSAADQTGFEYRLNGGTAAAIGTSPATVSGLTASTPYSIEVRAVNASGPGAWSAPANFTTSAAGDVEPPTLTGSVTFTSVTQTSYIPNWPTGSDNVGVTGYEYQIGGTAGAWTDAGNNLSAAITGRTAGATETVYVRAYDAAGLRSTPAISGSVTLESIPASGINVTQPLKNNTGTVLASQSGVRVAVLQAADLVSVYETTGLTTNASGILATISDAAIITGQQYHVAIKLADGGVGITGPITAS